jgi:hypothetical protein
VEVVRTHRATTYAETMAWARDRLREGFEVWCIRDRESGIVVTYLAIGTSDNVNVGGVGAVPVNPDPPMEAFESFRDRPLSDFTVQRVIQQAITPMHGPECTWPRRKK